MQTSDQGRPNVRSSSEIGLSGSARPAAASTHPLKAGIWNKEQLRVLNDFCLFNVFNKCSQLWMNLRALWII